MREEILLRFNINNLRQINLGGIQINNDELDEIFKKMKELMPDIQDIFLDNNQISDQGVSTIVKWLLLFPHIAFLDLQFNQLDEEGIRALFTLKKNYPDLQFALHGNYLSDAGKMHEIESLYTSYNADNR